MKKVKHMNSTWKIKYPNRNIYVMRDHNCAFSAWEFGRKNREIKPGARLLHVDFHDDYLEPNWRVPEVKNEREALILGEKLEIFEFIKAAEATNTIKEVYMIGDYDNPPEDVIHSYTYHQFENEHRMEFFRPVNQSFILDLDLDFFNLHAYNNIENNLNGNPFRYSDEYIKNQLGRFKQYDDEGDWDLITVCISPEHCGGHQTAQEIFDIFIEFFGLHEEEYVHW
ncbi:UPF0489 family protein [Thalassobacillus sp. CUG 92003]|uniref:UPF0489 family protein n=1 Tax=Thalassobacillus sp. CUG 92003 TaxID=2736641 RepID=UPI0015E6AA13|nr:UPF0489 family protein [Thalassobacillus sp. CUG 92003]